MHIVICEDEPAYQGALMQAVEAWQSSNRYEDIEVTLYTSTEELLEQLERKWDIDLIFLDIKIPGEMDGLELARRIRSAHIDVTIVFCTNYSEYVYEGYTVNALRFLKKPVSHQEVSFCCNYVYHRMSIKNTDTLTVVSAGKRHVLRYVEIRYIEVRGHNLYISTTLSPTPLKIAAQLSDLLPSLPRQLFVPCHRSFVVNIAHVRLLTRTECQLLNRLSLPVSRTYAPNVIDAFDCYHQGGGTRFGMDAL